MQPASVFVPRAGGCAVGTRRRRTAKFRCCQENLTGIDVVLCNERRRSLDHDDLRGHPRGEARERSDPVDLPQLGAAIRSCPARRARLQRRRHVCRPMGRREASEPDPRSPTARYETSTVRTLTAPPKRVESRSGFYVPRAATHLSATSARPGTMSSSRACERAEVFIVQRTLAPLATRRGRRPHVPQQRFCETSGKPDGMPWRHWTPSCLKTI